MNKQLIPIVLLVFFLVLTSCVSTKSTLKNVDNSSENLVLNTENAFVITEYAQDEKYGFDKDYPINLFYHNTANDSINQKRFFNALVGPNNEKITYEKVGVCCPFPSKNSVSGAALLDIYEVKWTGQKVPLLLYLNRYERSPLLVPKGFLLKKF